MSKNRLQNIVSKLQLIKKDKTDLVNIINSNSITEELKDLGIEYYDVIIKCSREQLEELTESLTTTTVRLELIENYAKNITEGLKKANKALNVYFIMDNTLFVASVMDKSDGEYPNLIIFGDSGGNNFGNKLCFSFDYELNEFTITLEEM